MLIKLNTLVMSRDENAGRNHSIKIDNISFERVEGFKYLGKCVTNQNFIQKEITSGLKSGKACYFSVQNVLSSSLLFKYIKIKIYRTKNLPVVLYGCETWSLTLR
jgi:UDP-galactopyranose mutase